MTESIQNKFLFILTGSNFSGRSHYLKSIGLNGDSVTNRPDFFYIGEQPSNFISGIFPTVKNEIELHSAKTEYEILNFVNLLFAEYGFQKHMDKNPFTLSGGEQAVLVILSNLLLQPKKLAIDTTIEQLNIEWRLPLLNAIQAGRFGEIKVFLSDNRLNEYGLTSYKTIVPVDLHKEYKYIFEVPIVDYKLQSSCLSQSIELSHLSFKYDKQNTILNEISISIEAKTIYLLRGRNGAGKTTLAKILAGILKLRNGKILVNGAEYNSYRYPGRLAGYSFQNPDEQIFSSTVENEVLLPKKNEEALYTERREIFLKMFGLQNVRKCHPAELPFVIRKRISLAATLATDRPWYILDEPTLGQDNSFAEFLIELLHDLASKGKGIIIISHSESFMEKIKGKNLNLNNGDLTF